MMKIKLLLLLALILVGKVSAQEIKPRIFIGPQLRDGFIETSAGVRDSVADLQNAFRHAGFILADRDHAELSLFVIARTASEGTPVTIGQRVGTATVYTPIPILTPTLRTLLTVGTYESQRQNIGSSWKRAAKATVRDVEVWLQENRGVR